MKGTSEIVHAALLELAKLHENFKRGMVTRKEVENYKKQADGLKCLCEAANIENNQLVPQFTEIYTAMQVCIQKLKFVEEYRLKLDVVVDYCQHISKGM